MVGGAPADVQVQDYTGADGWGNDVAQALKMCSEWTEGRGHEPDRRRALQATRAALQRHCCAQEARSRAGRAPGMWLLCRSLEGPVLQGGGIQPSAALRGYQGCHHRVRLGHGTNELALRRGRLRSSRHDAAPLAGRRAAGRHGLPVRRGRVHGRRRVRRVPGRPEWLHREEDLPAHCDQPRRLRAGALPAALLPGQHLLPAQRRRPFAGRAADPQGPGEPARHVRRRRRLLRGRRRHSGRAGSPRPPARRRGPRHPAL